MNAMSIIIAKFSDLLDSQSVATVFQVIDSRLNNEVIAIRSDYNYVVIISSGDTAVCA